MVSYVGKIGRRGTLGLGLGRGLEESVEEVQGQDFGGKRDSEQVVENAVEEHRGVGRRVAMGPSRQTLDLRGREMTP
jgi:hypothetical protein